MQECRLTKVQYALHEDEKNKNWMELCFRLACVQQVETTTAGIMAYLYLLALLIVAPLAPIPPRLRLWLVYLTYALMCIACFSFGISVVAPALAFSQTTMFWVLARLSHAISRVLIGWNYTVTWDKEESSYDHPHLGEAVWVGNHQSSTCRKSKVARVITSLTQSMIQSLI